MPTERAKQRKKDVQTARAPRKGAPPPARRGRRNIYLVGGILGALVLGVGIWAAMGGLSQPPSSSGGSDGVVFPAYVMKAPGSVRAAYSYAVQGHDVLQYVPCYCGCGVHSGHQSAWNCFIADAVPGGAIRFDDHGANCDMCVDIALTAEQMSQQGNSISQIRAVVTQRYGSLGPGTNTLLPPV
ncbi:MAG: hypothetical protein HYX89_07725 [Chloroflexi bacterium]|nr:hypothetical protein [Chloroflexota bacterium]